MNAYEATRVVLSRILVFDPENAANIMGFLLLQDHGEKEMIRLALGPEALLRSVVVRARRELGILSTTTAAPFAAAAVAHSPPPFGGVPFHRGVPDELDEQPHWQHEMVPRPSRGSRAPPPSFPYCCSPSPPWSPDARRVAHDLYGGAGAGWAAHIASVVSRQIYLTFPADSTFREEDVSNYFSLFGPVQDVRIPYQQKRMFGFVSFVYPETARLVLSRGNPHFVCDSRVLVKPYKEKGEILSKKQQQQQLEREHLSGYPPSSACGFHDSGCHCEFHDQLEEQRRAAELKQEMELQCRQFMSLQLLDLETLGSTNYRNSSNIDRHGDSSSLLEGKLLGHSSSAAAAAALHQDAEQLQREDTHELVCQVSVEVANKEKSGWLGSPKGGGDFHGCSDAHIFAPPARELSLTEDPFCM